jgi:glutamine amidotransferase
LGIIAGQAIRLTNPREGAHILKVPQIGWNRIHPPSGRDEDEWVGTPLQGCRDGTFMYFVHSYVVAPDDASVVSSVTRYGDIEFCASVRRGNVFGCQFHPERSADDGLRVYANLHRSLGAANRSQSRSL